jgi:trigger factor
VVIFDFEMQVDGKAVEGGQGRDVNAELGSASLLLGLGDAMEGKEPGAVLDVDVIFPENYLREELRGKSGHFHLTLKDVKERVLPELDDEFAKDVGSFDTLEALRADVRARLQKAHKERADNQVAEALVIELCKKNPVPVPPSLVEQQAKIQENEILQQARQQGNNVRSLSLDVRRRIAADAEMKVRAGLLMAEIAKAQKILVNDDDVQMAYAELAEQTGQNINKIKVQYRDAKQREVLVGMIIQDKVLDIIEAAARIEDEVRSLDAG